MLIGYFTEGHWFQNALEKIIEDKRFEILFIYCLEREAGDKYNNSTQLSRDIFNFVRALTKKGIDLLSLFDGRKFFIYKTSYIPYVLNYKGGLGSIIAKKESQKSAKSLDNFIALENWSLEGKVSVGMRFNK